MIFIQLFPMQLFFIHLFPMQLFQLPEHIIKALFYAGLCLHNLKRGRTSILTRLKKKSAFQYQQNISNILRAAALMNYSYANAAALLRYQTFISNILRQIDIYKHVKRCTEFLKTQHLFLTFLFLTLLLSICLCICLQFDYFRFMCE